MHAAVRVSKEGPRGCGYRKLSGLYLVSDGPSEPCGRLPVALHRCPCCGTGIVPSRGWTWVSPILIAHDALPCKRGAGSSRCQHCIVERLIQEASYADYKMVEHLCGLLWVGEQFYSTPREFSEEAAELGISRRVHAIPRGFKLGETPVMLAHRKGAVEWITNPDTGAPQPVEVPAVFSIFVPSAVEVIVSGDESDDEIEALVKRGLTPVKVERLILTPEQQRFEEPKYPQGGKDV